MDRAEIGGKAGHDFRLGRGPCARIAAGFLLPKTTLAQAADACVACHTGIMPGTVKQGEDSYFVEFEKVVSDDNMPWEKTDALLFL